MRWAASTVPGWGGWSPASRRWRTPTSSWYGSHESAPADRRDLVAPAEDAQPLRLRRRPLPALAAVLRHHGLPDVPRPAPERGPAGRRAGRCGDGGLVGDQHDGRGRAPDGAPAGHPGAAGRRPDAVPAAGLPADP